MTHDFIKESAQAPILSWLGNREFDRFVTLATNDPKLAGCEDRMRDLLREWEARVNRSSVGKSWLRRPDECMFGCFFQEKGGTNPHWHGVTNFGLDSDPKKIVRLEKFDNIAAMHWRKLCPSGSVDISHIYDPAKLFSYITKDIHCTSDFDNIVWPGEFSRR